MKRIPKEKYLRLVADLPILCVDVIIKNTKGEHLLLKRSNPPRENQWWVIGGRVLKGESLEKAAIRKIKEEVGLKVKGLIPVGYYEEVYGQGPFGRKGSYHPVSIVFSAVVNTRQKVRLDNQSSKWGYSKALPSGFRIKPFVASFI